MLMAEVMFMQMIFYLCHLWLNPTEQYAVRTIEECNQLERLKGARASAAMPYRMYHKGDQLRYEAQCGPKYYKCPIWKGN